MSTAFVSRFTHLADIAKRGTNEYIERIHSHTATAHTLQQERTQRVPGELSYSTHWENPQALRQFAHELELAQECEQLARTCVAISHKALMRQYQHAQFCEVRTQAAPKKSYEVPGLSLREVSNIYAKKLRTNHPPNSGASAPPVLSTCHASNAPGLSPVPKLRQVRIVT